jgi:hypothetical protein
MKSSEGAGPGIRSEVGRASAASPTFGSQAGLALRRARGTCERVDEEDVQRQFSLESPESSG